LRKRRSSTSTRSNSSRSKTIGDPHRSIGPFT
jgi:hypothetical protein